MRAARLTKRSSDRQYRIHPSFYARLESAIVNTEMRSPIYHRHCFAVVRDDHASGIYPTFFAFRHSHGSSERIRKGHLGDIDAGVKCEVIHAGSLCPFSKREAQPVVFKKYVAARVSSLLCGRRPFHISEFISLGSINSINRMLQGRSSRHVGNKVLVVAPPFANRNWIPFSAAINMPSP